MSDERTGVDRRDFLRLGTAAGVGAAFMGRGARVLRAATPRRAGTPMIITSHTNDTGKEAMRQSWEILARGGSAMDAVEKAANVIEVDPEDTSVGYGGLPNAEGVVQLDASCMDGRTYNAGSVGAIENIKTPSSVARLVMERTDHIMLVGAGALAFAKSFGFKEENLLTEKARQIWVRWREGLSESDDWGPPDHLRGLPAGGGMQDGPVEYQHGTTNCLAVDGNGDIAGITTTSGMSWKVPGRVGDSPIIGAGLYVLNGVGAAGATGRGEDVIKSCASYYIVMRMRDGRSPQEACEDAIQLIIDNYRGVNPDFIPGEKFVAINAAGEVGCASMGLRGNPALSWRSGDGLTQFEGRGLYGS